MIKDLSGKNNPNYRHGKYVDNRCPTCDKKIDPRSKYCHKCRPNRGRHIKSEETKRIIGEKSKAKFTPEYLERIRNKHRGNKKRSINGYILIKDYDHPNRNSHNDILEHILVMSDHLGRPLTKGELVHHIDGDRENNIIENLYLCEDRKRHGLVHGSLIRLTRDLLLIGAINFDLVEGIYKISGGGVA